MHVNTLAIRGNAEAMRLSLARAIFEVDCIKTASGSYVPDWAKEDEEELLIVPNAWEAMTNAIVEKGL